jgi:hypothetical protein
MDASGSSIFKAIFKKIFLISKVSPLMTACHEPTRKGGVPHRGLTQAKVRAMCFSKSPQTPLYKRGALNGISLMQTSHLPPLLKRLDMSSPNVGIKGDFTAPSSSRKSLQHPYSKSQAKLYHQHSRWILQVLNTVMTNSASTTAKREYSY